jgi:hypothetical protein
MKMKFILVIIALTSVWSLSGQSLNLLNSNKLWSNLRSWRPSYPNYLKETNFIKFSGDTTIESMTYKKVIQSYDSLKIKWNLIGFVREEPLSGLYFRNLDEQEGLLYKYNLQLNDTFTIVNTYLPLEVQSIKVFVKDIDSVAINGTYKRRYMVRTMFNTDTLIEDLGSTQGIMFPCAPLVLYYTLLCYYENDVLVYKNSNFERCYYNTLPTNISQVESRRFKIYPNPSRQEITILFADDKHRIFSIYDGLGCQLNVINFNGTEYKLDISKYPPGIYYVTVQGQNQYGQEFIKY